jgi:hypothetical protein
MTQETPYHNVKSFVTKQSILAFIFSFVVASDLSGLFKMLPILTSILNFVPVIICLIGTGVNIFLAFFSKEVETQKDFVYRTAPIILGVGWIALLVFFSLQTFGAS